MRPTGKQTAVESVLFRPAVVATHLDTLLVVTGDHENGGLAVEDSDAVA